METTELERYQAAHAHIFNRLNKAMARWWIDRLGAEVDAILQPPPTYEEVTVERWLCPECGNCNNETESAAYGCCGTFGEDGVAPKLTGTRRVPVKQPVRKRVSVKAEISDSGVSYLIGIRARPERRDHPDCHGKTGTLTFEWEE